MQKTVIPGVSAPVRGVRLGQYRPDVARVVIDLTDAAPYQISPRRQRLVVIYFDAQPESPGTPIERERYRNGRERVEASTCSITLRAASPLRRHRSIDAEFPAPRFALAAAN